MGVFSLGQIGSSSCPPSGRTEPASRVVEQRGYQTRKRGDTGRHHPYLTGQDNTTTQSKGPPNPFDHAILSVQTTIGRGIAAPRAQASTTLVLRLLVVTKVGLELARLAAHQETHQHADNEPYEKGK